MADTAYSSAEVCALAGITYRKLDYWCRAGLVSPSLGEAGGYGSRRRWSVADVAAVRRVAIASEIQSGSLSDALDRLDELVAASAA